MCGLIRSGIGRLFALCLVLTFMGTGFMGTARAQEIATSAVIYQFNVPGPAEVPGRSGPDGQLGGQPDGQAIFDLTGRTIIFKFDPANHPTLVGVYPFKAVCGQRIRLVKDEAADPGLVDGASLFTAELHQQLLPGEQQTPLAKMLHSMRKLETSGRVTLPFLYGDLANGFDIPHWVTSGGQPTDQAAPPQDGRAHLNNMTRAQAERWLRNLHVPQDTIHRFFENDLSLAELEQFYRLVDNGLGVIPPLPTQLVTNPPTNGHQEIVLHFNGKDYDRTAALFLLRGMGMRDADINRFFDNQLDLNELDQFWTIVRRADPGATTMVKVQVQIAGQGGIVIPFTGRLTVQGSFEATVPLDHADDVIARINELRERMVGDLQEAMQRYGERLGEWVGDLANRAWERLQSYFGNQRLPWWFHLVP